MHYYKHTLNQETVANARPTFQSYLPNDSSSLKRYYSSADASLFFDNKYIDDAAGVEFALNESSMMLFGYNSFVFDKLSKGARMVQGQLVINFTKPYYMLELLDTLGKIKGYSDLSQSSYSPLWYLDFDIYMNYGTDKNQIIKLQQVYLTGVNIVCSTQTGEPIQEVYSFVAQDVIFDTTKPVENWADQISEDPIYTDVEILKTEFDKLEQTITVTFNKLITEAEGTFSIDGENIYRKLPSINDSCDVTIPLSHIIAQNPYVKDIFNSNDLILLKITLKGVAAEKEFNNNFSTYIEF